MVIFTSGSWSPCVLCYFHSCKHCWERGWMSGTNTRQMASLLWPIDPSYLITFLVQEQRQRLSDKWFFSELLARAAPWFSLDSGRDGPISAPTKAESDEMFGGPGLPFSWKKGLALPTATEGIRTQLAFLKIVKKVWKKHRQSPRGTVTVIHLKSIQDVVVLDFSGTVCQIGC